MEKAEFFRQHVPAKSLPAVVAFKWGLPALEEGFVPLPKKLLRCVGNIFQGPEAMERFAVTMAIADYLRPNLTRGPSREFLGFLCDLPVARINMVLADLTAAGLVIASDTAAGELEVSLDGLLKRIEELTKEPAG